MIYDTIVIGGGPAGMTAAIKAKETCEKAKILIIDRNKKLGKKLYATGNGRCNIANSALDLSSYHSCNEFFPYQIINTESYKKLKEFFMDLGVAIYDDGGYLYPQSMQASTVVWALSDRIKHLGIEIHTTEEAESVEPTDEMYGIVTDCENSCGCAWKCGRSKAWGNRICIQTFRKYRYQNNSASSCALQVKDS